MSGLSASESGTLSLRERLRLQAQQRLESQERATTPKGNGAAHAGASSDSDEDGVPLPALTLGGRPQRQAARNAPKSYDIDPTDPTSALGQHPHARPTLAMPTGSRQASDDVMRLLREKSRRSARGTDSDGFSRAEAIAMSMERARLSRMGIAADEDSPSGSKLIDVDTSKPSNLTVRALSPTIPSYMWSSESEAEDEAADTSSILSSDSETSVDADSRIAASLLKTAGDSKDAQAAVDILRKDTLQQQSDRAAQASDDGRVPFWREGRTSRPSVYVFCRPPEPGLGEAVQDSQIDADSEWDETAVHVLLAGAIPPSLQLSSEHVERLIVWSAFSFVLSDDSQTSHLSLELFHNLLRNGKMAQQNNIESALGRVLAKFPAVLKRIGVRSDVLDKCFPEDQTAANELATVQCPVVRRNGMKRKRKVGSRRSRMHLTLTERDEILIKLCHLGSVVLSYDKVPSHLSKYPSIAAILTVAAASGNNLELQTEAARCVQAIFALPLIQTPPLFEDHMNILQGRFYDRLQALRETSLPSQARLVFALTGAGIQLQEVRRILAWSILVGHREPVQETFTPYLIDLTRLESVVNSTDTTSPFYISPMGAGADAPQTDYQGLIAATHLLAATLQDLPVHMCSYDNPGFLIDAEPTPEKSSAPPRRVTALTLAMTSYKALRPSLDPARVSALHRITAALGAVGNKIRDNRGDIVLRTLAKDLIQRTVHALEYQLALFDPASAKRTYDTA